MAIITADDLKTWLNLGDALDDTSLGIAAASACTWVKQTCGRSFEITTSGSESSRVFEPKTATLCITDDFSTTTNLVVKVDNGDDGVYETTLTASDYWAEPLNGIQDGLTVPYYRVRCDSWLLPTCNRRPSVQVTARWGWTAVPDAVKQAALIEAARLFKRRTSPEGVLAGFQDFGASRIQQSADPDARALLNPYVRAETALLA